ncbi:MAG TPA: universal stress protein [Gemmatimonadaceae bacterium]|nr:universal stress protein [Gemmatimonadaceae bacterium]
MRRRTVVLGPPVVPPPLGPSPGRVLIAVDFSTRSLAGARWVARHLVPDAEVVLAHVLPVPHAPLFLRGHLRSPQPFVREVAAPMRGSLEGLAEALGAERVRVELRAGEPAEQLADVALTHDVDLVCVGRPRHRGDTVKLGRNTVDRLLRQTRVPLLQAAGTLEAPPSSILTAVDGGAASASVLRLAWSLAARLEAQLTALHVVDEDVRAYVRAMEAAAGLAENAPVAERALWNAAAEWLAHSLEEAGARSGRCHAMVGQGDPGQAVLSAARQSGADLIVIGRSGHDALSASTVGSTTRLVLRAATCPVLVVPDTGERVGPPDDGRRRAPLARRTTPGVATLAARRGAAAPTGDDVPPAA